MLLEALLALVALALTAWLVGAPAYRMIARRTARRSAARARLANASHDAEAAALERAAEDAERDVGTLTADTHTPYRK